MNKSFFLIAGPCLIEGEKITLEIAEELTKITEELGIEFIFKGSFKKANRTSIDSFSGIGDKKALKILKKVSNDFGVRTITDVHETKDIDLTKEFVDIIQIPAFLCRQTELIVKSAQCGLPVNIKKGQFLSANAMKYAVDKFKSNSEKEVYVTDRGTMFGYKDLIVDFRGIPTMKEFARVILDITHSVQRPNQDSGISGGQPNMIETLAKAGIACGVDGIFLETHPDPKQAKSDSNCMLSLNLVYPLLKKLKKINRVINQL